MTIKSRSNGSACFSCYNFSKNVDQYPECSGHGNSYCDQNKIPKVREKAGMAGETPIQSVRHDPCRQSEY